MGQGCPRDYDGITTRVPQDSCRLASAAKRQHLPQSPSSAPRRQAERNNLADKLMVEAKVLADLKIEWAAVEGERPTVEAELGPVKYLATLFGQADEVVLRWFIPRRGAASGPGTPELPAGAIPAATVIAVATIAVATIAVTIVSVKTQAARDAGTSHIADHPASDEAWRAE